MKAVRKRSSSNPARIISESFVAVIAIGTLLLHSMGHFVCTAAFFALLVVELNMAKDVRGEMCIRDSIPP